jgi:hypothetical protein
MIDDVELAAPSSILQYIDYYNTDLKPSLCNSVFLRVSSLR